MTQEECAAMGEKHAVMLMQAIDTTMSIPGLNKQFWWCGFLASLSARCYMEVGPASHALLAAALKSSLETLTGKNETRQ